MYHGSLVFEDSHRCTVPEYTECHRLYSQLDRYYAKLERDSEKKKQKAHQQQRPVKPACNAIPSDSESESCDDTANGKDHVQPENENIMPPVNSEEETSVSDKGQATSDSARVKR